MKRWVLYGAADLLLAPKGRVSRRINRQCPTMKDKIRLHMILIMEWSLVYEVVRFEATPVVK